MNGLPVALSSNHRDALNRSVSSPRLEPYLKAANSDHDRALDLYLWDRELSVAFLGDLAILEVALRNAMSKKLADKWGEDWVKNADMPLDDRSLNALNTAWNRISEPKTSGKLIAQCMFGFWRGLLDKGDYVGKAPRHSRCDYETLWRGVLDKAFPGGRDQAQRDKKRWNRDYAFRVVSKVNELRNRVAHHEPLINGMPLSGQRKRVSAQEAHENILRLAAMLDRDLHSFLMSRSRVPALIRSKP